MKFSRRYSAAHRLLSTKSEACQIPHGHNWVVTITIEAGSPTPLDLDVNMVAEFKRTKSNWHAWVDAHVDHSFQLNERDPLITYFKENEPSRLLRILVTPGDPTTEVLAALWQCKAQAFMDEAGTGLIVSQVHIQETPTNAVTLIGAHAYREHLPAGPQHWWNRADGSISDGLVENDN